VLRSLELVLLAAQCWFLYCYVMVLRHREPGTSLWRWPGAWITGIWSLPVTARGRRYRRNLVTCLYFELLLCAVILLWYHLVPVDGVG
jgi:hypothetical protein